MALSEYAVGSELGLDPLPLPHDSAAPMTRVANAPPHIERAKNLALPFPRCKLGANLCAADGASCGVLDGARAMSSFLRFLSGLFFAMALACLAGAGCGRASLDGDPLPVWDGGSVCPTGTICSGACVDLTTDQNNCGNCSNTCPTGNVCNQGACSSMCFTGTTDCNGGCVDLTANQANCGACGRACPSGVSCVAGECACAPGTTFCNGLCVDVTTNPANCGQCGLICPTGDVCAQGKCAAGCGPGTTDCDGACVNLSTDAHNCGTCGDACPSGDQCVSGKCGCLGQRPATCNGQCVDLATS